MTALTLAESYKSIFLNTDCDSEECRCSVKEQQCSDEARQNCGSELAVAVILCTREEDLAVQIL
jgi:hypothetical protein